MSREEEILQRAKENAWYIADTSQTKELSAISGYCLGAKYADKTMIDKACEWLRDKIPCYIDDMIDFININSKKMESDFRKAMLEEE